MPVFEYSCSCGAVFKRILNKAAELTCKNCGDLVRPPEVQTIVSKSKVQEWGEDVTYSEEELERRVAADAEMKWEKEYKAHDKIKKKSEELGTPHLMKNSSGEIVPVPEEQLKLRKRVKEAMVHGKSESGLKPTVGKPAIT